MTVPLPIRLLVRYSLLALVLLTAAESRGGVPRPEAPTYERDVRPFVTKHCVACHGPDTREGDLRLDTLKPTLTGVVAAEQWIEVMDRLNLGEMPPEDEPRPDPHELRRVAAWIAAELRAAEKQALATGGRMLLRRMNRTEYTNTIRDLLGVEFFPGEGPMNLLPPDGTAEGFDKVSAALTLDPSLLDKYFEVGRIVAEKAIVDGPPEFPTEKLRLEFRPDSHEKSISRLAEHVSTVAGENGLGIMQDKTVHMRFELRYPETNRTIATKGDYTIRLRAWADSAGNDGPFRVRISQNHPVENLALDRELIVSGKPEVYEFSVPRDPQANHWAITFVDGTPFNEANQVFWQIFRKNRELAKQKDFRNILRLDARRKLEAGHDGSSVNPAYAQPEKLPKLWVDDFEVEGPLYKQWPPAGHQFLFFKGEEDEGAELNRHYAREMFQRLLPRAFRRPVQPEEVESYAALVAQEMEHGQDFKQAVRSAVAAVLTSPSFVYLFEPSAGEESRQLTGHELASRLSYFLWSTMPDDTLFELAEAGELSDPAVLERQVDRMLADEKSEALVRGFAVQWLRTDEFRNFTPDPKLYPDYDEPLGEAMVQEPLAFFREILQNDIDALAFINSDWTMLNQRLANHCGIDGVTGDEFRRVSLPADSHRGGLLGMAGVAMRGSDGQRTKPVNRAVYVREVLFNDPPDPPPPNAGEIEPNIQGENLTVRERLLQHQQIAACASCHRTLDPYGLALENFNVLGRWREHQDGEDFRRNAPTIDPSGSLPNGKTFDTFAQYRGLLAEQDERFCRGLAEKLLVYAIGRPVEATDRSTINAMTNRMIAENRTLRSLIKSLVTSEQFRQK